MKDISVKSMVASRTGEPVVMFRFGGEYANLPIADARKVALDLLGAADREELEAKLVAYLRRSGAGDEVVVQTLTLLRNADEEGR